MDLLLEDLLETFSTSGNEELLRNVIVKELDKLSVKYREDKMGNLIVDICDNFYTKNTIDKKEKVMICAHMDNIGFIVTGIDDKGLIKVASIGEFDLSKVVNNYVSFKNGTIGKLYSNKKDPKDEDLFIDLALDSKKEVEGLIKEGDVAVIKPSIIENNNNILSSGLNNKIGCFILFQIIKMIKNKEIKNLDKNNEFYFVFSTQNILGGRGARAAANIIAPDYAIVLDMEEAKECGDSIYLGRGPAIKILDKTLIINREVKEKLDKVFERISLKPQYIVNNHGGDGGFIHKEGNGTKTGALGIPCRYINTSSEIVNKSDIENTKNIIIEILKEF